MTKISKLTDKKVWLAPLAGITDINFRKLCKTCGADVMVTEMVSADGLVLNPGPSLKYARFGEDQRPLGIQLFGSDPEIIEKAVHEVIKLKPDFVDFNMGCPVKKVIKRGAGSALMKDPDRAVDIVKSLKRGLDGVLPLSVKIRSGWDLFSVNAIDLGLRIQDAGADLICFHARTRTQMYSGKSNWELIARLKEELSIPVVGNGDIRSAQDASEMYKVTGCDSIMVGRGAIGRPWIFREIKDFIESGKINQLNADEKYEIVAEHCRLTRSEKSEEQALKDMRTHFAYYTKGLQGGSRIRDYIFRSLDLDDNLNKIKELYYG